MMASSETVTGLKQSAEKCMKDGRYAEAFFHLTHAIKLCPESAVSQHMDLLSLRSKCFLRQQQFYLAMQDALELVKMDPTSTQVHPVMKFFPIALTQATLVRFWPLCSPLGANVTCTFVPSLNTSLSSIRRDMREKQR